MAIPSSTKKESIEAIWKRIAGWLDTNWYEPVVLPTGVTEAEIIRIEDLLGMKLPKDLKQSYQLHDGTGKIPLVAFDTYRVPFPLISISAMYSQWTLIQKGLKSGQFSGSDFVNNPQSPIQKVWFHPKWLPVVDNQGGDYVFVDMSPAKSGRKGQVIDFFRFSGATRVLAQSFKALLESVANDLEAGVYKVDKKTRSLILADVAK